MTRNPRLLTALLHAQETIAAAGPRVAEVLLSVVRHARELTGADAAFVELVDDDAVVTSAAADAAAVQVGAALPDGTTRRAYTSRRLVHWNRDGRDTGVIEGRGNAEAVIATPLETVERIVGVLTVVASERASFDADAEHALRVLARVAVHQIEQVRRLEIAERASRIDPLTGLGNRRAFDECLSRELARHIRYQRPLSLCLVDIDDFKAINDTHGHPVGDRVLVQVGQRLSEMRGTDAAFRLGGDEFAVVLPETTSDEAGLVARRLARRIREGTDPAVGASWGIAEATGPDAATLLAAADAELYARKRTRRPPGSEATG